ncbi:MAG TPA: transglutaminase family protein [Candidatus Obscuribacterales bacterium]
MHYQIAHTTTYSYSQPVTLAPHLLRLRPRCDASQSLQSFSLVIDPKPLGISQITDLDGNAVIKLWFQQELTDRLQIQVLSQVETLRSNPFDYLMEAWALKLPIDYPASLHTQLKPYLSGQTLHYSTALDPVAVKLAQEIHQATGEDAIAFLSELSQRIHQTCKHTIREFGEPLAPGITWAQRLGSCRDLTVLFMEACRAIGLAARFVSGYEAGDRQATERHLHAWAEVYLPGAGWRGYDPTQGLAVADHHIALVASAAPSYAAPISGTLNRAGAVQSSLKYHLSIQTRTDFGMSQFATNA